jgi:hypothetical protein
VTQARFVAFIEPCGYSRGRDVRERAATARLLGLKRLPVIAADGRSLSDRDATALELDFGGPQVIVILNETGQEVRVGDVRTNKRFAARDRRHDSEPEKR